MSQRTTLLSAARLRASQCKRTATLFEMCPLTSKPSASGWARSLALLGLRRDCVETRGDGVVCVACKGHLLAHPPAGCDVVI